MPEKTGQLKIYFSYACMDAAREAMLRAARLRQPGIEPSRQTDPDVLLSARPSLVVMEDLAQNNPAGSRHTRRYHDVQELLKNGIDVYAALDLRHIESLHDTITEITGIAPTQSIPDFVFDNADFVEFVPLPQNTTGTGLTAGQLEQLRRLALDRLSQRKKQRWAREAPTTEHILVCLSSAPSNPKIVRTGARMAAAFRGRLTALFVKTPETAAMSPENRQRLWENTRLAESLGASIEESYGEDVPYQIAEFARLSGVTKIVLGRSTIGRRHPWSKPPLSERLAELAPNLDIHIIPDSAAHAPPPSPLSARIPRLNPWDLLKIAGIFGCATAIGFLFYNLGFTEANIITLYLLAVLFSSTVTTGWPCYLLASVIGVVGFNFCFTVPRFTLMAYDKGYPVTFAVMLLSSLLTGSLAARLKNHAQVSARQAVRNRVLFETNQRLQKAGTEQEVAQIAAEQIQKLLSRAVILYGTADGALSPATQFGVSSVPLITSREEQVALWVLRNNKRAGATTDTFPHAACLYLATRMGDTVYGVVGIEIHREPLDTAEQSILLSLLGECAIAIESKRNAAEKEAAALLAQSEQLRANLLRSISHDLRTPLTAISGNASNLLSNGRELDEGSRQLLYQDIYNDSMWLIGLVENLLAVTRIENGQMQLRTAPELVEDILQEALHHIGRKGASHHITVLPSEDLLFVQADARLVVQVIVNLLDNAIKYTPPGSRITVSAEQAGQMVSICVRDNGPGIPDSQKETIFDMFTIGSAPAPDSRRSLGLGLYLCRCITNAHGGTLTVTDNVPSGTAFTMTLPIGEVTIHEETPDSGGGR